MGAGTRGAAPKAAVCSATGARSAAPPLCTPAHPAQCPCASLPPNCPQAPALSRLTTLPKKMLPLRLQLVKSLLLSSTGLEAAPAAAGSAAGPAAPAASAPAAALDLSPTASAFVVTEERGSTTATLPRPQYPPTLPLPRREPTGRPQPKSRPEPRCPAEERAAGSLVEPPAWTAPRTAPHFLHKYCPAARRRPTYMSSNFLLSPPSPTPPHPTGLGSRRETPTLYPAPPPSRPAPPQLLSPIAWPTAASAGCACAREPPLPHGRPLGACVRPCRGFDS